MKKIGLKYMPERRFASSYTQRVGFVTSQWFCIDDPNKLFRNFTTREFLALLNEEKSLSNSGWQEGNQFAWRTIVRARNFYGNYILTKQETESYSFVSDQAFGNCFGSLILKSFYLYLVLLQISYKKFKIKDSTSFIKRLIRSMFLGRF